MSWFINLSTRYKLSLGFGILTGLLLVVVAMAYNGLTTLQKSQHEMFEDDFTTSLDLVTMKADLSRVSSLLFEVAMTQDQKKRQDKEGEIGELSKEIDKWLKAVEQVVRNRPEERQKFDMLTGLVADYREMRDEAIGMLHQGKEQEAERLIVLGQNEQYSRIRSTAIELGQSALQRAKARIDKADKNTRQQIRFFLIMAVVVAVFCLGTILFMNRIIADPLREITIAAGKVAGGDPDVDLQVTDRKDEVGQLARAFAALIKYLQQMAGVSRQIAGGNLKVSVTPVSDRDLLGGDFRDMAGYLRKMATVAGQVSAGNLTVKVEPVSDQDILGNAFAEMITNLQDIQKEIRTGVNVLASSAGQILASTSEIAASISQTATSASQTTATVEEVRQTTQLSVEKARNVSDYANQAETVAEQGNEAIMETIGGINHIKGLMDSVTESVLQLSEQTLAIGTIITVVTDLAQQSNLLAVNAAIEASKAGEHGRGFQVVAQEIKSLADQSKQATGQVRTILADIQKAMSSSVLAAEQVSRAVEGSVRQATESGESIRKLTDSISKSAHAALQISASSQEQLAGMEQVVLAMDNIRQASQQNASGTRQAELAAHSLNELGQKLKALVENYTL